MRQASPCSSQLQQMMALDLDPEAVIDRLLAEGTAARRPLCPEPPAASHLAAVDRAIRVLPRRASQLARLNLVAEMELVQLTGLPPARQQEEIEAASGRFRNPILVDLLIEESQAQLPLSPRQAHALAEAAYSVALRLSAVQFGRSWVVTAIARAQAQCGRTFQTLGEPVRAAACLEHALQLFDRDGTADPCVEAELLARLAELRGTEGRQVEAEAYLDMAQALCERCQADRQLAGIEALRSRLRQRAGDAGPKASAEPGLAEGFLLRRSQLLADLAQRAGRSVPRRRRDGARALH